MILSNSKTGLEPEKLPEKTVLPRLPAVLLALAIVIYIVAIMLLHWLRQERFMNGFDMAFYEQAVWNTAHGRFLEVSATDFSRSILGTDVLLIFALMSPLYALVQSPYTLLFQETLLVALGALPIYWLARDRLNNRWAGLMLALVYLLLPGVMNGNLYELRERPVAMGFWLFAFYFYERNHFWPYLLFGVLAMSCRPENGLVLVMLALYAFIGQKHRAQGWKWVSGPLVLGAGWFAIATLLIIPGFSTNGGIALSENFAGGSPLGALKAFFTDWAEFFPGNGLVGKSGYVPLLLLPLLFLPLGSPSVLLMALPSLALNLISKRPIQWNAYDYHYQGSIIPWLIIATIFTLEKWQKQPPQFLQKFRNPLTGSGAVLAATLLIFLIFNLIFGLNWNGTRPEVADTIKNSNGPARILTARIEPRWEAGKELLKLIPTDAPLAITNVWATHVPPRQDLWLFKANKTLYSVHPTRDVRYVFADLRSAEDKSLVDETLASGQWETLAEKQSYIVLKRK